MSSQSSIKDLIETLEANKNLAGPPKDTLLSDEPLMIKPTAILDFSMMRSRSSLDMPTFGQIQHTRIKPLKNENAIEQPHNAPIQSPYFNNKNKPAHKVQKSMPNQPATISGVYSHSIVKSRKLVKSNPKHQGNTYGINTKVGTQVGTSIVSKTNNESNYTDLMDFLTSVRLKEAEQRRKDEVKAKGDELRKTSPQNHLFKKEFEPGKGMMSGGMGGLYVRDS